MCFQGTANKLNPDNANFKTSPQSFPIVHLPSEGVTLGLLDVAKCRYNINGDAVKMCITTMLSQILVKLYSCRLCCCFYQDSKEFSLFLSRNHLKMPHLVWRLANSASQYLPIQEFTSFCELHEENSIAFRINHSNIFSSAFNRTASGILSTYYMNVYNKQDEF